jgi:hypothetical protein
MSPGCNPAPLNNARASGHFFANPVWREKNQGAGHRNPEHSLYQLAWIKENSILLLAMLIILLLIRPAISHLVKI